MEAVTATHSYLLITRHAGASGSRYQRRFATRAELDRAVARRRRAGADRFWCYGPATTDGSRPDLGHWVETPDQVPAPQRTAAAHREDTTMTDQSSPVPRGATQDQAAPSGPRWHAVRVHWAEGTHHDDEIRGADQAAAVANAHRNWITATPGRRAVRIEYLDTAEPDQPASTAAGEVATDTSPPVVRSHSVNNAG